MRQSIPDISCHNLTSIGGIENSLPSGGIQNLGISCNIFYTSAALETWMPMIASSSVGVGAGAGVGLILVLVWALTLVPAQVRYRIIALSFTPWVRGRSLRTSSTELSGGAGFVPPSVPRRVWRYPGS